MTIIFYGTDIMRKRIDDNFWIDKTLSYIDNLKSKGTKYIIITDIRFDNEIVWATQSRSWCSRRRVSSRN